MRRRGTVGDTDRVHGVRGGDVAGFPAFPQLQLHGGAAGSWAEADGPRGLLALHGHGVGGRDAAAPAGSR